MRHIHLFWHQNSGNTDVVQFAMPTQLESRNNRPATASRGRRLSSLLALAVLLVGGQQGCQSTTQQPNAVRDLLIDRIAWQPYPAAGDSTSQGNQHQFAITNTSARYGYRRVQLCFDYCTQTGRRIGSDTSVIDTLVEPGTLIRVANRRIGRLRPGTDRTVIRVLSAATE